jgi:cyclic pyranopterin phosphate synthase
MNAAPQPIELNRSASRPPLVDPFGRSITYLRVSVTDRCDFRCVYCMSEDMAFLPEADLLTLEELDRLCSAFVSPGRAQAAHHRRRAAGPQEHHDAVPPPVAPSRNGALDELTLTTNGSQLAKYAASSKDHGVRRINVSIDTLDPDKFRAITRWGDLTRVLAGVDAAKRCRPQDQDQRGGAQGRQRARDRGPDALVRMAAAWT